ncbi:MAG TPA: SpoIIE family protein phosphatase [Solirubrobacteraceae bacterium]|nr:SpoIIE family protein phosphatase [Solirubrobacteraceae bacterium]
MAAALAFAVLLPLIFASPAPAKHDPPGQSAAVKHGHAGGTGATGTTPAASAPYGEEAQAQSGQTGEASSPATPAPASSGEAGGQPATSPEKGKTKSSAAPGHAKAKHSPKREAAKTPRKTPEAPVASVAEPAPAPVTTATPTQTVHAPVVAAPTTTAAIATKHAPARAHSGTGTSARSHRTVRRPARRVASASTASGTSGAVLAAATSGARAPARSSTAHGAGPSAVARQLASERRPSAATSGLPLVHSVTRIINVVPPLIRALIGLLIGLALLLAISSRITAARARRLLRQREELLDDVGLLQGALLPPLPARIGPIGTSAAYQPASGPGAGGDFYDVFALGDGRIAVILGDVSGHGRDALPQTTLLRFTLRAYIEAGLSPRTALATAGPVLERQLGSSFATVAVATYDPRERQLVFSCAGHPPPLVLGSDAAAPITSASAPPIGVGAPTGTRQTTVSIPGSALVCFYTDGVVEARTSGALFGSRRLQRVLASISETATAETLLTRIDAEIDARPDDMAACLLRIEGGELPPAVTVEELALDMREIERDRATRFLRSAGVHPAEIEQVVAELRRQVARHGRVVLELHLGEGAPEIVLSPQNVATLQPTIRAAAGAQGALT